MSPSCQVAAGSTMQGDGEFFFFFLKGGDGELTGKIGQLV